MTTQTNPTRPRPKPGPRRQKPGPRRPQRAAATHSSTRRSQPKVERPSIPIRPDRPEVEAEPREPRVIRWWLIGVVALVAAIVVSVLEAPMFEARSVQMSGNARTSEGLVLDALAIPPDQALLLYDMDVAEAAVAELPWVEDVSIVRQWPSTVQVVISEHAVAAAIGRPNGSEWLVVAESGVVVERRPTPPGSVPLIIGTHAMVDAANIGAPVADAARALEIALDVPGQLDPWITTWSLDEAGQLTAELVGSAEANFGAFEDSRTQFVSLASILNGGAELTCLDRIDLSVADTPVLYRNRACINEAAELG